MSKLVIDNVDPEIIRRLKALARANRVSVSEQAAQVLGTVAVASSSERFKIATSIASLTPAMPQTDAVLLLRGDRDR